MLYFGREIRALQKSAAKRKMRLLVGMSDDITEGSWRYVDATAFVPQQADVFRWHNFEPSGGTAENCVFISWAWGRMHDKSCGFSSFYGICEIRTMTRCSSKRGV